MATNATTGALPAVVTIVDLPTGTTLTGAELLEAVQTVGGIANSIQVAFSQIMTSTFGALPAGGGTGQVLDKASGTSFAAQWVNLSSLVTASSGITVAGSTTLQVSLSTVAGLSVLGVTGTSNAVPAVIVGTADQVLVVNHAGTGVAFGPVNLATSAAVTGILAGANYSAVNLAAPGSPGGVQGVLTVPSGGHGTSTLTPFGVVFGNGSATVGITAAGTTGWPLVGNGTSLAPAFAVLTVPGGGHGTATLTLNGVVFGNGSSTVGITAAGATGTFLSSQGPGAAPVFTTTLSNVVAGGGLSGGSITGTGTIGAMNVVNLAGRFGGFDVWQRLLGNSSTTALSQAAATTLYQNDGWYLVTGANQAATITQASGIATGSLFAATVQRNSGQTGTTVMRYAAPLDSDELASLQGNFVALSFTAKAGANWSPASGTLNYTLYVGTGAVAKRGATAYTNETLPISGSANLITTATRYSAVATAVVATTTTQAEIQLAWTPATTAGANDSFTPDDMQLEIVAASSSVASPFQKSDLATQNLKALRFFRVIGGTTNARYGPARTTSTTNGELIFPLVYPMRSAPSAVVNNVTNWVVNDATVNAAASTTASTLTSVDAVNINLTLTTTSGTATPFRPAFFSPSNATATMYFSSEI